MSQWENSCLRVGAVLLSLATADCAGSRYLDPDKFQQNMAQYATLPDNKAVYISMDENSDFEMFWSSGARSVLEAASEAKSACENYSTGHKADPKRCVPVAQNDKQIYDPVPGSIEARQRAEREAQQVNEALQQFATQMQSIKK
jgi:hypothetical protein